MVIKGFFSNSVGIMISRILGLFRDLLTASILGASIYSDIFFIAFKIPNLFRRIFGEGAFTQAFLPNFTKSAKKSLFLAEIFLNFLIFIVVLTTLVNLFTPFFTSIIATGLDEKAIKEATPLVKINFFYLILIYITTFLASLLQYKGHFATTAFSTALLNLAMIGSLLLSPKNEPQAAALYLSFGVIVGGVLQVISHIIALKFCKLSKLFFGGIINYIKGKRTDTKGFFGNFYHGVVGSSAMQISSFMDTWLASFLISGSISYLFYANRIFQLPLAIFAIALSTALFPKITRQIRAKNDQQALILLNKCFEILLFLLLGSAIGGIILSEFIIKILFERGSFTHLDTLATAKVLSAYLIGLVPFGLAKLFSLWLYAKLKQKIASKISIICLIINLTLAITLMQPFGAFGLAIASSLGGFILLGLNIKEFGAKQFLAIIRPKILTLMILVLSIFGVILIILRNFLYANF